jgi:ABC-2 type transport system ATP-binding protein
MEPIVLRVRDLQKTFATVQAVRGVSFDVRRGEVFALLGPNGAGKTTLTRMLLGIIKPDDGKVEFCLEGPTPATPTPAQTGYLPEDRGLYQDIPTLRTLTYFGVLRGMTQCNARREAQRWLERFELRGRENENLQALSKGNQQKVQLIASILHRPIFAVFDEPFSGFDPINQQLLLDLIGELRAGGMTILLSSHQMQLVERVADRVLLISHGRTVLHGTLDEIRRKDNAQVRVSIAYEGHLNSTELAAHPAVAGVELPCDGRLDLMVRSDDALRELLQIVAQTLKVRSVHTERLSLHDIYVRAVRSLVTEPGGDIEPEGAEKP